MLLTLDPGLDDTSYALWHWPARCVPLPDLPRQFVETATWPTIPSDPDPERLSRVGGALKALLARFPVGLVVIERANFAGAYQRRQIGAGRTQTNAADLRREREAAGVLAGICIAAGVPWEWHAPTQVQNRHRAARLDVLGLLPKRSNKDQRAALLLGVAVLTDARRRWSPPAARRGVDA